MAEPLPISSIPSSYNFQHEFVNEKTLKGRAKVMLKQLKACNQFSNIPDELRDHIVEAWEKIGE